MKQSFLAWVRPAFRMLFTFSKAQTAPKRVISLTLFFWLMLCVAHAQPVKAEKVPTGTLPIYNLQNKQPIFGVAFNLFGNNGHRIYDVSFDNGTETSSNSRLIFGIVTTFGVARKIGQTSGQNMAIITVLEDNVGCGSGTAFYNLDLNTGSNTKLGTAINYNTLNNGYIEDIEFNPIDGKLYGIANNKLIRVNSFGSACYPSNPPVYANVEVLGTLINVGFGPYSVSFDYLGTCYVVSAIDHNVAKVILPTGVINPNTPLSYTNKYQATNLPNLNAGSGIRVSSCMSGTTLIIGVGDATSKSFYHWSPTTWTYKGNHAVLDYTSTAKASIDIPLIPKAE
jgi:hypothetical protein